ncbi:unnamed protein product [Mucor hiemalis]
MALRHLASNGSLRIESPTSSTSVTWSEELPQPVLPWVRPNSLANSSTSSSTNLHTMKRYLPEGQPTLPIKTYKRWTGHKIWLICINCLLFSYGLITLILGLCTYFKLYQRAMVILVGERTILNLVTATGVICLFTSLIGFVGIVLNNRAILAIYNVMMWPCLGMIAAIGYTAYRKNKWNIEGKLSYQWHYNFNSGDRANIQANLHCCGYKSFQDFHVNSNKCYPRTLYPGCKFKYQTFTKQALDLTWIVAFSMIPVHLLVLFSALLCSNHVNNKFGKGLPPKLYHVDYRGIIASTPTMSTVHLERNNSELHRRNNTISLSS